MSIIVDVSVALPWNVAAQATDLTEGAAQHVQRSGGVVPFHFHLELANALLVLVRRRRLTSAEMNEAVANIQDLGLTIDNEAIASFYKTVLPLAETFGLTAYDAAYLELAIRSGLPLATRDEALRTAAIAAGVTLFQS